MSDPKIDADARMSLEATEASAANERATDSPGIRDSDMREKGHREGGRGFEPMGRVVWRRQSAALVELGVCASWCALVSRGPSASISRFGLRTSGSATWVFARPRCADVGCAVKPGMVCSAHPRQSRR
jgi:hypothetical protein